MRDTTTNYDVAEHLRTPEEVKLYLEACKEESRGDTNFMEKAQNDVARAAYRFSFSNPSNQDQI